MRHGFRIYISIVLRDLGAVASFLPIDRFVGSGHAVHSFWLSLVQSGEASIRICGSARR